MLGRLRRRWLNIKTTSGRHLILMAISELISAYLLLSVRHWPDVVLLLNRRRRRWPNIETALCECLVFAGHI